MEKINAFLETQLENEVVDFNAEDYRKIEKEDERFRQARKKD